MSSQIEFYKGDILRLRVVNPPGERNYRVVWADHARRQYTLRAQGEVETCVVSTDTIQELML